MSDDILKRFEVAVRRDPTAVAAEWRGEKLSYQSLDERSNQIAGWLKDHGVETNARVAILCERSFDMLSAIVGVLKAGAAYLPIDPEYPKLRKAFMLEDAEVTAVLTSAQHNTELQKLAPKQEFQTLVLDDEERLKDYSPEAFEVEPIEPDDLCYLMYTSGSTGKPKGVAMPHGPLQNLLRWQSKNLELRPSEKTLQFSALSFDVSFQEIFSTLLSGGTLVLIDAELRLDNFALLGLIDDLGIARVFLPFIALDNLAQAAEKSAIYPQSLKQIVTAGEQLRITPALRSFFEACHNCRLYNHYGPTETHVVTALKLADDPSVWEDLPSIGWALPHVEFRVLDADGGASEVGELLLGGGCLAKEYWMRPTDTAEKFIQIGSERFYRSGDRVRVNADQSLNFLGRMDDQLKFRGYRVELGEIEAALSQLDSILGAAAKVYRSDSGNQRLVAYLVLDHDVDLAIIQENLRDALPTYMAPDVLVPLKELPRTPSGKIDRKALSRPEVRRPKLSQPYLAPQNLEEKEWVKAFEDILEIEGIGVSDHFFELGGNSLQALRLLTELRHRFSFELPIATFFDNPRIESLLSLTAQRPKKIARSRLKKDEVGGDIAVVGMALDVPGADNLSAFWDNLLSVRDSVYHFDGDESGVDDGWEPKRNTVWARGLIDSAFDFDEEFFNTSPLEAKLIDPQQRILLRLAHQALADAGIVPQDADGVLTGVFAGVHTDSYRRNILIPEEEHLRRFGDFNSMIANDKDYVASRIAHHFDLRGPAISINTACSTSLVAIVNAVQQLRLGTCDLAIAGAASLSFPQRIGHNYVEGGMLSRDGRTCAYDAAASGTVFSDGAALVVLKRLDEALEDGDRVYVTIKGVGLNNDGANKASFSAPNVQGQSEVIRQALRDAKVSAQDISYVEGHGTATPLGDPIEVAALAKAFSADTQERQFCALGSVKSNLGHLVTASGVVALIKCALMCSKKMRVGTVHYQSANPHIDFGSTPFFVESESVPWDSPGPRLLGLSNFGVGGTNAHLILSEAPAAKKNTPVEKPKASSTLFMLSAKTQEALCEQKDGLIEALKSDDCNVPDVGYTLWRGRQNYAHRASMVVRNMQEARSFLQKAKNPQCGEGVFSGRAKPLLFMFPGQGSQYVNMGLSLFEQDAIFRSDIESVADSAESELGEPLLDVLYPKNKDDIDATQKLQETRYAQPALFALEYALARFWIRLGLVPDALMGHSIGEFVSATLAGVFLVEDAAKLVAIRGRLMNDQPPGKMLGVRAEADSLTEFLHNDLEIAAINSPKLCVLAGKESAVLKAEKELESRGIAAKLLHTSHAFHTAMMDGALAEFESAVASQKRAKATIPMYSTSTGMLLENAEDPSYWAEQLRRPVLFSKALRCAAQSDFDFLEVGPRNGLCSLLKHHRDLKLQAIPSMGDRQSEHWEWQKLQEAVGKLFCLGHESDWKVWFSAKSHRVVSLPAYPFKKKKHAVEIVAKTVAKRPGIDETRSGQNLNLEEADDSIALRQTNYIKNRLWSVFEDVSGIDISADEGDVSFLELGLDSLLLTQLCLRIQDEFAVEISFRQLMEDLSSLNALVDALEVAVDPAIFASDVKLSSLGDGIETLNLSPSEGSFRDLENALKRSDSEPTLKAVIQSQLSLMKMQIQALGGRAGEEKADLSKKNLISKPDISKYDIKKAFGAIARITTEDDGGFTPRQLEGFEILRVRYNQKTKKSKEHAQEFREKHADPRVVTGFKPQNKELVYPIVCDRSKGAYLWDIDGNCYIDALNGFGSNFFGYGNAAIAERLKEQIDVGYEIGPQTKLAGEAAALVCELTGHERAAFCNTGSEAVMGCMRVARTTTGRHLIVSFDGAYHGIFDEVLVRGTKKKRSIPAAPGILPEAVQNLLVLDYGTEESLEIIRDRAHELAAVLVEPVQSRRPDFQPKEFLRELRRITQESGTALIFDEVITGFRTGPGGAQSYFGVRADLASYGKIVGGGMPIGVVAGNRPFIDALDGGAWSFGDASTPNAGVTYFAGTFVRHPLAMAASLAALKLMKAAGPELQNSVNTKTEMMANELNNWFHAQGLPFEVRFFASLWKIFVLESLPFAELLFVQLRDRGIHIWEGFPCFLTMAHTDEDIQNIVESIKDAVGEMQNYAMLPKPSLQEIRANFRADMPPIRGARLGRDRVGQPGWFVEDKKHPGQFIQLDLASL